jgi:hypothetical protein
MEVGDTMCHKYKWHNKRAQHLKSCILKKSKQFNSMTEQKFHTISIEDREMFAYNARYAKYQQHMEHAENPIKYCFEFLKGYIADGDDLMAAKCYNGISKYSDKLDWSEAHF